MNSNKIHTPQNISPNNGGRLNKLDYRDGYLQGREIEHQRQEQKQVIRDNDSAASGLLFGLTVTALTGLMAGAIFFAINQNQPSGISGQAAPTTYTSQP